MRTKSWLDAGSAPTWLHRAQRATRVSQRPQDAAQPATGRLTYRDVLRRSAAAAAAAAVGATERS